MNDELRRRGLVPPPDFQPCTKCEAPGMCKIARHCAKGNGNQSVAALALKAVLQSEVKRHAQTLAEILGIYPA